MVHEPQTVRELPSERSAVVGLGNPGEAYEATRHNLGFRVVDALHRRLRAPAWSDECASLFARTATVDLVKPQTFMNRSGHAVRCLLERYGYRSERVLVVYDDIALPLGVLRMRPAGGPGGHRGLASVISSLRSEEVPRLRLGIAPVAEPAGEDLAEFVLRAFAPDEEQVVERQVERAAEACETWLARGVEPAMSAFNGPLPALAGGDLRIGGSGEAEGGGGG